MHNKFKPLIITLIAVLIYCILQMFITVKSKVDDAPVITFDDSHLEISVHDSNHQTLLQGVYASDKEDGDLTDQIIIEEQSVFINDTTRSVSYLVFDSNNHVTRANRLVTYTDYTAPVFSLIEPLRGERYSVTEVMKKIKATSAIDGDISNKITIMDTAIAQEDALRLKLSVSDSTNTTAYLSVNYYLNDHDDIDIILNQYLIYLNPNETYDFRSNIINVIEKLNQDESLIQEIEIEIPDMSEKGIYEVNYSISRKNGNKGKTTMIVVVR